MMRIRNVVGLAAIVAVVCGCFWLFSGDNYHSTIRKDYFTVIGFADYNIKSVEAKIMPLDKTILWNDVKGDFFIKLTKEEACKMEIIKFKFQTLKGEVIESDFRVNATIALVNIRCMDGEVTKGVDWTYYL